MNNTQLSDFYAKKGKLRYTIILSSEKRDRLKEIAAQYGVAQQDIIEAMIDSFSHETHIAAIEKIKAEKGGASVSKLTKKLKKLSPEKLAEIEKLLGESN